MHLDTIIPAIKPSYDPLPEGIYEFVITQSEVKNTKSGTGRYLSVGFQITEPSAYAGRMVYHIYNFENKNPMAVDIALKDLGALLYAVNWSELRDSDELLGQRGRIAVGIKDSNRDDVDKENVIKKYLLLAPVNSISKKGNDVPF